MIRSSGFAIAIMALAVSAGAENLTQANVAKAQAIIDAAVEAFGGAQRLDALQTIYIEQESSGTAVGQSLKPEPPWDRNNNRGMSGVDLENRIFVTANQGVGGGFEFDNANIINGDQSFALDYRAGTATPIAEPDFDTASGPFIRVTPVLLMQQLRTRAHTALYLGEAKLDGARQDVIGFTMAVGPAISLYFDTKSHMLVHSERILPGFGLVEYSFGEYVDIDGVPFNKTFALHLNGDLNIERRNTVTRINEPLDKYTMVDEGLERVAAVAPDEMSRQEIADGVYLIGGSGTYGMFIEMRDHVIAVGGTGGAPDRIKQLREVVPKKPIRYGVMTHHHSDHVLAVPTYIEHGATIVTAKAHAKAMHDAAGDDAQATLSTVDKRMDLSDDSRKVKIIDIGPTAHSEHLLVVWLPDEGILFEADHFAMPRTGDVRPAVSSTRTFAKSLRKNKIKPAVFVSAHSPRTGSTADLKAALDKKVMGRDASAAARR